MTNSFAEEHRWIILYVMQPTSDNVHTPEKHDILVAQGATRTLQKDTEHALAGERGALVKEAIMRDEALQAEKSFKSHSKNMQKVLSVATILVLVLAVGIIIFTNIKNKHTVVTPLPVTIPLINSDRPDTTVRPLSTLEAMTTDVATLYAKEASIGEISTLAYASESRSLIKIIDPDTTDKVIAGLTRNYTLGLYEGENGPIPFLLLSTTGTDGFFEGVIDWEKSLRRGFFTLFQIPTMPNDPILYAPFENTVVENKDVRIVYDEAGEQIFVISFLNNERLLIATNTEAIRPILARIRARNSQ